ncbi:IRF3 factor, partial [Chordeiles acutipennis]|nr:IRF3 factor [Chordeiles acutipennis]
QAWAKASGRYEGCPDDPAKWKTNFRCALSSTRMFKLLEDRSKCGDDPHKVFAIASGGPGPTHGGDVVRVGWAGWSLGAPLTPLSVQPTSTSARREISATDPTHSPTLEDLEMLQWVLQQCDISSHSLAPSWASAGERGPARGVQNPGQNNCQPPPAFQQWVPAAEQPPLGTYSPLDPLLLGEQGGVAGQGSAQAVGTPQRGGERLGCCQLCPVPKQLPPCAPPMVMPTLPVSCCRDRATPVPPAGGHHGIVPILDISIYYRGKLFHQEEVRGSQCLLVYQPSDPALALRPGRLVRFPSPAELADGKQRRFTEELLGSVGLQLEQRASKLFATRLKKCKVFWALSQQLEGVGDPPPNLLYRDQETPIFDFNGFCTELRDFRNGQRQRSPDFTIYLCFGQSFSKAKPKESKLILVKLVPKFCEYWYEQVLREGASSLDSGTISLQLSDSFSLFELIEQCNMQLD